MKAIANLYKRPIVATALFLLALPGCQKQEPSAAETPPEVKAESNALPSNADEIPTESEASDTAQAAPPAAMPQAEPAQAPQQPSDSLYYDTHQGAIRDASENDLDLPVAVTPRSKVKFKVPEVVGGIDKRIIQKVTRQHSGELRTCYSEELETKPTLTGSLTLQWTINTSGSVSTVEIKERDMSYKNIRNFENCLVTTIRHWRFPAPKGGHPVKVTYPIEFEPPSVD
ncbi:MAG: TonB family protein [Proteobacteria bacterium]|nr:TonB family protein [Pseudomonadota bacterium]